MVRTLYSFDTLYAEGGYFVAQGTPEQIAQEPASYSGQFLADVVKNG